MAVCGRKGSEFLPKLNKRVKSFDPDVWVWMFLSVPRHD
jgi:hypothetical protein